MRRTMGLAGVVASLGMMGVLSPGYGGKELLIPVEPPSNEPLTAPAAPQPMTRQQRRKAERMASKGAPNHRRRDIP